ncbi:hypothetical protein [Pedobacter sp. Leaf176]|uniref:hypothetical protein n=1 Tax=Pedobacter sp. Leaf176 TaxID=1736286 RepID=UPI0006F61F23|nr:hypothetical protein [Pedobacter sp. Leaf176]KQR70899.1 hypothetical protein ASF92_05690 [Pedobacter sp. Leaf176]
MKKIFIMLLLSKACTLFAQDSNILIGLDNPAHGITSKINIPGYTGGYSRGYSFTNEDLSIPFISFGVSGSVLNGKSTMNYGFIGSSLGNPFMSFSPNGNIGIGTTTNPYKLNINGPAMVNGAIISSVNNAIGGVLELKNPFKTANTASSTWRVYNMGGNYGNSLQFWAYSDLSCENGGLCANRFTLMDNGNVGIGSFNPTGALEIMRLSSYGDEKGALKIKSTAADQFVYFSYLDAFNSGSIQAIKPGVGAQNLLLNAQGGNIGIGTTNPTEKLAVNGNVRAKEIKVETVNWPDYVFDQDYKILGLQELDAYIRVNKHLPDMPSAKEAELNGIELGEMNKLLLKKVEELTLHLIEKDKALVETQKKVIQLTEAQQKSALIETIIFKRLAEVEKALKR